MADKALEELPGSSIINPTDLLYATISGNSRKIAFSDLTTAIGGSLQPLDGDLTAISALSGTDTIYYRSGTDTWSPVTIGTNLTFAGGTLAATGVAGSGVVDWVSVMDHGAVGNGVADDTAAIQAAIDAAVTAGISTIYMPSGRYKTTTSIYLDPASNLRTAPVNVTKTVGFTLALIGDDTCGSETGGTRIEPTSNQMPGLIVGPGQGMLVRNISIIGPSGVYRANQRNNSDVQLGCGIGLVGGGGASRYRCENCFIVNFYVGFVTGLFGDGLGDSGTYVKCAVFNAALGFWIQHTQNFINSFYDCNPSATTGLLCSNGASAHIFGGNWSLPSNEAAALTAGTFTNFTATAFGNTFIYAFKAVVTPDAFFTGPDGVYNAFTFFTAGYGPVPCRLTAFDTGTHVADFEILIEWSSAHYGTTNTVWSLTEMQTELTACTQVFCAERCIVFRGNNMTIAGIHIENNYGPTCLVYSEVTFGGPRPNWLSGIFFNTDSSQSLVLPLSGATNFQKANYYACHTFPFIYSRSAHTTIEDSTLGLGEPVPVDTQSGLEIRNCDGVKFNMRCSGLTSGASLMDRPDASGTFDTLYFLPQSFSGGRTDTNASLTAGAGGPQTSPHWGFRPAAWSTPAIAAADKATLAGALPAISPTNVTYPMIWGGQVYRVYDFVSTAPANFHFVSNHKYYSYGQNLNNVNVVGIAWSYKGQSHKVNLDAESLKLMRQGLQVILNDGVSDISYIVTGVEVGLGFITVSQGSHFIGLTSGLKTATIGPTNLIKQQPYAIVSF